MFRITLYLCVLGAGRGAERGRAWGFEAGSESTAILPVQGNAGPGHDQGWILRQTGSLGKGTRTVVVIGPDYILNIISPHPLASNFNL